MHKIYLLSPYCEKKYRFPQMSLEYIRFYLKDSGYNAEFIDCSHYSEDLYNVIARLKEDEKPIIGITAYTRERFHAYNLIKKVRKKISDSLIVVGGHHFGFLAEETLAKLPEVDIVVRGEGEITFKEICDSVYSHTGYKDILGISYRNGEEIIHNSDRPLEMNLDKFRNFDVNNLPDLKKYTLLFPTKTDVKNLYFTIYATRGCPNSCVFCGVKASKVRFRSIANIIKEIEDKIKVTGVRNVTFADSSLTHSKRFVIELCEKIIERKLKIRWNCYSRVDINSDILKLMKEAGLVSVEAGLESGSPLILKSIKKNINLEQFEKFCKRAHGLGIKVYVFCMISLPDERLEDTDMTLFLIRKISPYIYKFGMQVTRILPDAALYNIAKDKQILPKGFDWFKPYFNNNVEGIANPLYKTLPFYLEHLTIEDIKKKKQEAGRIYIQYFTSFSYFKQRCKENLGMGVLKLLSVVILKQKILSAVAMLSGLYTTYKNRHFVEFITARKGRHHK